MNTNKPSSPKEKQNKNKTKTNKEKINPLTSGTLDSPRLRSRTHWAWDPYGADRAGRATRPAAWRSSRKRRARIPRRPRRRTYQGEDRRCHPPVDSPSSCASSPDWSASGGRSSRRGWRIAAGSDRWRGPACPAEACGRLARGPWGRARASAPCGRVLRNMRMESFSSALFVVKYFDKGVVECGLGKHRMKNIIGLLCLYTGGRGGGCVFDVCARTLFELLIRLLCG